MVLFGMKVNSIMLTTEQTTETKSVDVGTNGDNANAEYNDVDGNQYNDNATHNETKGGDK